MAGPNNNSNENVEINFNDVVSLYSNGDKKRPQARILDKLYHGADVGESTRAVDILEHIYIGGEKATAYFEFGEIESIDCMGREQHHLMNKLAEAIEAVMADVIMNKFDPKNELGYEGQFSNNVKNTIAKEINPNSSSIISVHKAEMNSTEFNPNYDYEYELLRPSEATKVRPNPNNSLLPFEARPFAINEVEINVDEIRRRLENKPISVEVNGKMRPLVLNKELSKDISAPSHKSYKNFDEGTPAHNMYKAKYEEENKIYNFSNRSRINSSVRSTLNGIDEFNKANAEISANINEGNKTSYNLYSRSKSYNIDALKGAARVNKTLSRDALNKFEEFSHKGDNAFKEIERDVIESKPLVIDFSSVYNNMESILPYSEDYYKKSVVEERQVVSKDKPKEEAERDALWDMKKFGNNVLETLSGRTSSYLENAEQHRLKSDFLKESWYPDYKSAGQRIYINGVKAEEFLGLKDIGRYNHSLQSQALGAAIMGGIMSNLDPANFLNMNSMIADKMGNISELSNYTPERDNLATIKNSAKRLKGQVFTLEGEDGIMQPILLDENFLDKIKKPKPLPPEPKKPSEPWYPSIAMKYGTIGQYWEKFYKFDEKRAAYKEQLAEYQNKMREYNREADVYKQQLKMYDFSKAAKKKGTPEYAAYQSAISTIKGVNEASKDLCKALNEKRAKEGLPMGVDAVKDAIKKENERRASNKAYEEAMADLNIRQAKQAQNEQRQSRQQRQAKVKQVSLNDIKTSASKDNASLKPTSPLPQPTKEAPQLAMGGK